MEHLLLFLELLHCALNAFLEVKLELSPLKSSTIIIVDGGEDVSALGIIHWYFHLPEHLLEFLQLNIEAVILIDLPEQSSERDICSLQSNVNLVEHTLLHLQNSFRNPWSSSLFVNLAWVFLHIDLSLVLPKDIQETPKIDSGFLILVEVVDELVNLLFGDLLHVQITQDILEVLSRHKSFAILVDELEQLGLFHVEFPEGLNDIERQRLLSI